MRPRYPNSPHCPKCRQRHNTDLACWGGDKVARFLTAVLAEYGDLCCHCGQPGSRSVEHVRPRSLGGTDALANLRPAHLICNQARGRGPMAGYGTRPLPATRSDRW